MSRARMQPMWISIHRWSGLGAMLFLFCAAVTGCLLCVDSQIDEALNPDLFRAPVGTSPPNVVEAVARFGQAHPSILVTQFPLRVAAGHTIVATVAPRPGAPAPGFDQAFIDPAGGHLIGMRDNRAGIDRRHIVQGVFSFHYTLLGGTWGRWLMGASAVGWLVSIVVGFYITLPVRGAFWAKWRRAWAIDWKARLRWLLLDVHRASGLWLLPVVIVLALTSVAMNFFEEAFDPTVQALSPARASPFDRPAPRARAQDRIGFAAALTLATQEAARRRLDWQPAAASYLPDRNLHGVMFTRSGHVEYSGLGPVTLYYDGGDGRLVYADDPYSDSAGRKLSRALYPLHSGAVIGTPGTALVFVLGLATAEMCVTGLYVWWKKRRSRQAGARARRLAGASA